MDKYIQMIEDNNLEALGKIFSLLDLIEQQYKGKYLIEYLLEQGVHTKEMDDFVKYHYEFATFYLKYNVVNPLLKCSLHVLLRDYGEGSFLEALLSKIDDKAKMQLYNNVRINSYNGFRNNEQVIVAAYSKFGIELPNIFINVNNENKKNPLNESDKELIEELRKLFSDHDRNVINYIINLLQKGLITHHDRAVNDIKKLIDYKKKYPKFSFVLLPGTEGNFKGDIKKIETSINIPMVFDHEFSHLLLYDFENKGIFLEYDEIRKKIDVPETIQKIKDYIKIFHRKYEEKKKEYECEYYEVIKRKYGSMDHYIEVICKDIMNNEEKLVGIDVGNSYFMVEDCDIKSIVLEIISIEKSEYITNRVREFYSKELMLENLLDALLMGKIFDDDEESCLSGHSVLYFFEEESNSFDECLADFDALRKADGDDLIRDLQELVGDEIVVFLERYIKENREKNYGNR